MEKALEIEGLRKEYKGFTLKDVTFDMPRGYIMGLIGPNGAGKTTIIKLIMNLIRRKAGEIKVFGRDNLRDEAEVKSRIGFVYDEPCFYEDLGPEKIVSGIAPFYPDWDDDLFWRLMEEFELPARKKLKKFSHGMKMKFALAVALSHDADLIVMDEPTSGLDPVFRRDLLKRLAALIQDEKKSVLFSTHITSDLEKIADYVTFINKGEIVFSTTKDDLLDNWGIVKGGSELLGDEYKPFFKGYRPHEFGVDALTSSIEKIKDRLNSSAVVEKASLEDIMFFMTRGDGHASANS